MSTQGGLKAPWRNPIRVEESKAFRTKKKKKRDIFILHAVIARKKHPGPNQINIETHKSLQRFTSLQWVPDL